MKITFSPNNQDKPSGVASFASWNSLDLQDAIARAFNTSPREKIREIVIERDGITAYFETKNATR